MSSSTVGLWSPALRSVVDSSWIGRLHLPETTRARSGQARVPGFGFGSTTLPGSTSTILNCPRK
eukprot:12978766-Alexandrium_andersonii.AAC.1